MSPNLTYLGFVLEVDLVGTGPILPRIYVGNESYERNAEDNVGGVHLTSEGCSLFINGWVRSVDFKLLES
jgi:hypothetical protein